MFFIIALRSFLKSGSSIMRKVFCVAFLLIFLFTLHTPAWAAEFVVGVSTGYPPYYYKKGGKHTGICVDLVNAVAKKMGLEVTYKVFPWKRLLLSAKKGEVDAIMPLFRTREREEYLYFDGLSLTYEINHFFTSTDASVSYDGDFEDIKTYRIGVVSNYSYGSSFDKYEFYKKIVSQDDKHLIEMFMHNRFDIGVGNKYVIRFFAGKADVLDKIKFLDPHITKEMLYIGFSKTRNNGELSRKFSKTLQDFRTTAEYQKLKEKYRISDEDSGKVEAKLILPGSNE